jgi:hypothetical protein
MTLPLLRKEVTNMKPHGLPFLDDMLIHTEGEKILALVSEVYPDLLSNYRDRE